ncbi:MAG TPA: ATP-binding protein [Verrucomicrobiae bacterium]|jgi:signal transduction histidine kinase/CheY-like chemotaxis protein
MRTLLVIAPTNALSQAIGVALNADAYRIIDHEKLKGDELRHMASSIDVCVVDAELTSVEAIRTIEFYRRALPHCPMILYTTHSQWDWEEDAYLLGVNHILTKPVRGKLLQSLMDRILAKAPTNGAHPAVPPSPPPPMPAQQVRGTVDHGAMPGRMLELLRNCSTILCHSLSAEPLLKEFVLLLREILGVNRAVIFLRKPANVLGRAALEPGADRLVSACAVGISNGVLGQFQLSLDAGIASYLFRSGRVLRRESPEAERDPQIRSEFDLLGTRVAIPVLDRESLVGVALFDGRVTGEPMVNEELALIFHLLEQLGLAIKNIWWHDQVSARHQMMFDILGQIKSGCVVIGRELNVLHANEIIRQYFPRPGRSADAFEFTDLPQVIGSRVFESLKSGLPIPEFKFQPLGQDRRFRVSISPFRKDHASAPTAALVVVEDCTAADRIQHLEIETANLRLVQQMAERLAHEIGNAVVPISTHQQLLDERVNDPDFQKSLAEAMEDGVKRVSRLVDQMRFLARDRLGKVESVPVKQLIEEAFREARAYHPSTSVLLQYESSGEPLSLSCDRQGLQHAFAEIILNALQANGSPSQVQVRTRTETDSAGSRWARIEVQDSGAGFSDEAAGKASEPFYTTRKVGLGLGLAVTNKIIQTHSGKMEIPAHRGAPGLVRISLPLDPPSVN